MEHEEALRRAVGTRVHQVRIGHRLNQKPFSEIIGMSSSQLSRLERGVINLPMESRNVLISTFGVNPEWLSTGQGIMYLEDAAPAKMPVPAAARKKSKKTPGQIIPVMGGYSWYERIPLGAWMFVSTVALVVGMILVKVTTGIG